VCNYTNQYENLNDHLFQYEATHTSVALTNWV